MVEAGDVDWANHANNLDNSIGAVLSGQAAFDVVMNWVDQHDAWDHTAVIVTADHGHFFVNQDPATIANAGSESP
jgi:alkaline phosphatase